MRAADFFKSEEGQGYLARFQEKIIVIKYGGAALEVDHMMDYFLEDVAEMKKHGLNVVLVHGGGKMLTRRMEQEGIKVEFVNGMRVTTREAAMLAKEVFADLNDTICKKLGSFGCEALPLTRGRAVKAALIDKNLPDNRVGRVIGVDAELIDTVKIPVISSIGLSVGNDDQPIPEGEVLNINADLLAVSVALSLNADKLIFISDVNGIYLDHNDPSTRLDHINESGIAELISTGVLHGGMKLKVEMALDALKGGVDKVHFIDGSIEHSLMFEIFTEKGIGTEIVHD